MRVFLGIIMGFFSGFLIYMALALLFTSGEPSSIFVFIVFFGGWILSTILLVRGARSVSKVIMRGFLLGAAEWLAMIPIGLILSGKAVSETISKGGGSNAEVAGATIGAGIISFITGGVSIAMAIVCLIGFTITYFIRREMKPDNANMKLCPECAETIKAAARKCKHCGSEIT